MTAVLVGNNRATRDAQVPPPSLREDGTPYPYRLFYDGGIRIADAEKLEDLIEVLIPGYVEEDLEGKVRLRFNFLKAVRTSIRAQILAGIPEEEWNTLEPVEKYYLEWAEDDDPNFVPEEEDGAPFIWKSNIPLVLVDAYYEPIGINTAPLSVHGDHEVVPNILWLRAEDELSFLVTLTHAGVVTFGTPRAQYRVPAQLRD